MIFNVPFLEYTILFSANIIRYLVSNSLSISAHGKSILLYLSKGTGVTFFADTEPFGRLPTTPQQVILMQTEDQCGAVLSFQAIFPGSLHARTKLTFEELDASNTSGHSFVLCVL